MTDRHARGAGGVAILAALLLLALPARAPAQMPTLRIAVPDDPTVWTAVVGKRIVAEAYRRTGYRAEFVALPLRRALRAVNEGSMDGDLGRIEGVERLYPNLVRVPYSPVGLDIYVLVRTGAALPMHWEDVPWEHAGALRGTVIPAVVAPHAHVDYSPSVAGLFLMLRRQRIDVALVPVASGWDERAGFERIRRASDTGPDELQYRRLASVPAYHYLNIRYQALIEPLARAFRAMTADGFIAQVVREESPELR
jgi:polar amino acid transport system substrate-binding protein